MTERKRRRAARPKTYEADIAVLLDGAAATGLRVERLRVETQFGGVNDYVARDARKEAAR